MHRQWCTTSSHAEVLELVRRAGRRLALGVMSDGNIRTHSLRATSQLLEERHHVVINPLTGAPVFTLEMMVCFSPAGVRHYR
jgi:hypothetical protein